MREDVRADLHRFAGVYGLCRVEGREVLLEGGGEQEAVGFGEDVPFHVRVLVQGSLEHGEEFPFVDLPALIFRFACFTCVLVG